MVALPDNDARRDAMRVHDRTYLVEAGAGSGKTAVLAGRIVMLLAAGVKPKHIVAVTFTELAASELLVRVRKFVDALMAGNTPDELVLALPDSLADAERTHLEDALKRFDEITCSTIHGFCQQLIKPYPVAADLDPGASVMDRDQADLSFLETRTQWLKGRLDLEEDTPLASLVWHDQAKSITLFDEVLDILREHPHMEVRQSVRFDDQWNEFKDAAASFSAFMEGCPVSEPETAQIVHALRGIAAGHQAAEEIERLLNVMSVGDDLTLFTKDRKPRSYRMKGKWEKAAQQDGLSKAEGGRCFETAKAIYGMCLESLQALQAIACSTLLRLIVSELRPVIDAYHAHKRRTAQLDFDDLIRGARDLLCGHEDIRVALGRRYTHVLVDEFQDTDLLQTEIFWRLCGDAPSDAARDDWTTFRIRPGALFLVGDPKQAIYRFRGADVAAYVRARELLLGEDEGALLRISTNFRSLPSILAHVNEKFEEPLSVEAGQPGFTPLDAFLEETSAQSLARLDVNIEPDEQGKVSVDSQRQAEADVVALVCAKLIGSEMPPGDDAGSRTVKPGDIALLAPSGTDLWRYEEALERLAIPVATQAGKGLYRRQEIQDLIALTRVLADSRDTLALGALLRGPLVGLSDEALLDIALHVRGESEDIPRLRLFMELEQIDNSEARDVIGKLQFLYGKAASTTPHHLISQAIDLLHVRPILMRRHAGQATRVLANVDLYLSMSRAYAVRGLKAFAEAMTAAWHDEQRAPEGRPDAQEESVALFTMHAAKGLEWRIVVPVNTMTQVRSADGQFVDRVNGYFYCKAFGTKPLGYDEAQAAEQDELDRERVRLWYVATTRARDLLVLPNVIVDRKSSMWSQVVDLAIESLPEVDLEDLSPDLPAVAGELVNEQTREVFAEEAKIIAHGHRRIAWRSPSRDEDIAAPLASEIEDEVFSDDDEASPPAVDGLDVQGGLQRGLLIHKLFEEVLTGECQENEADLTARAETLIGELGRTASENAADGLSPAELAGCVRRGLALPQVAELRPRLVSECSVFGSRIEADAELMFAGIADAIAFDTTGAPEVVIDWKTDVDPRTSQLKHYGEQVRAYLELTGAKRGLVVLVTSGRVLSVG